MHHVIFDTETTGLPDWRSPSDAPHQPHLVQLAMILVDDDWREHASVSVIIRPDGWTIPEEVSKIHGITQEMAMDLGISEQTAAQLYIDMLYGLGAQAVAHNVKFDLRIMRIAMLRAGMTKEKLDAREVKSFCTCDTAKPIINLPPTEKMRAAGFNTPKPPNLGECIQHFFGETLEGAHSAMIDARACLRVFRHLKTGTITTPMEDVI